MLSLIKVIPETCKSPSLPCLDCPRNMSALVYELALFN